MFLKKANDAFSIIFLFYEMVSFLVNNVKKCDKISCARRQDTVY